MARTPDPGTRPRVTAVVANYNYERYVSGAVSSLLDQTLPFDEVIVVDDGSTDDSVRVLTTFGDRIRLITKPNGGQLSAAWAALRATDADYIYLLDSDDIALPELHATVAPLLETRPIKVQFQLHSMDAAGTAIDSVFPTFADGYSSETMIDDNGVLGFYVCPPTSGNVFRTDYLRELMAAGLDEREAYDGVPAQAAPYLGEIVSLGAPLARYRVHDSSDSQWGRPTVDLLRSEIRRYESRWREVEGFLAGQGRAVGRPRSTVFVLEREIMIAVLDGRRPAPAVIARFARLVLRSGLARSQRFALVGWALAVAVVPRRRAVELVLSRRSAARRGRLLTVIARWTRRTRVASVAS